jgi:hypothetical protein
MVRGERPLKLGDSWFPAKSIQVEQMYEPPFNERLRRVATHCFALLRNP